jgi:hypothetical protein
MRQNAAENSKTLKAERKSGEHSQISPQKNCSFSFEITNRINFIIKKLSTPSTFGCHLSRDGLKAI